MPIIPKRNTAVKAEDVIETTNVNEIENNKGEKNMKKKIIKKVKPVEEIIEKENEIIEEDVDEIEDEVVDEIEDEDIDEIEDEDIDVIEEEESDSEDEDDEEEEFDSEDEDDEEEDNDEDDEEEESDSKDDEEEEDDDEDDEEEDDDEEESSSDENDKFNEIVEDIKSIVSANKDNPDGPARGRRLKEKFNNVKTSKLKAVKSANKEENLNSLVAALEENGMGFVFSGLKFATEKRAVAARILASLESAIIDCLYKKGTGFGIFNTRFELGIVEGKIYPALNNDRVTTKYDVLKKAHTTIKMNPAEIDTNVGLIYKNDGKSELSIPGKAQKDGSFVVEDENFFYKKGTVLDKNGLPVEKSKKEKTTSSTKKVVKKKK